MTYKISPGIVAVEPVDVPIGGPYKVSWPPGSSVIQGNPPTGPAGGDLRGTYPNPEVRGINGTILSTLPTGLLKVNNGTGEVSIASASDFNFPLSGDLSGGSLSPTVVGINGTILSTLPAGLLKVNNGNISIAQLSDFPSVDLNGPVTSSNGISAISDGVVTNTNLSDVPAKTLKGNVTASSATPSDLTVSQVVSLLAVPQLSTSNVFTKAQAVNPMIFNNASGFLAVDSKSSNNFRLTLVGDTTLGNPINLTTANDGSIFNWYIKQDTTGSHTLTFDSMFVFSFNIVPVVTADPHAVDFMSCFYDATDGVLICNYTQNYS